MILLDTNVVAELMKSAPDPKLTDWVAIRPSASLFTTTITEAELRYGVALLPPGRRRDKLTTALGLMLTEDLAGRILPFDSASAIAYATIASDRRKAGRPISQLDAQIASIAMSRGASVATRNVPDFEGCGIAVINPWEAQP